MSTFRQIVERKLPHVFVKYVAGATRRQDTYAYGVVGSLPTAQLIGALIRIQAELAFRSPEPCEEGLWFLAYDPETEKIHWFVDPKIPIDQLVGTLEIIKCTLVDSQIASMVEAIKKRTGPGLILGSK